MSDEHVNEGFGVPAIANPRLLCVDDEANILKALERVFRPRGYRVRGVQSGEAALEELERGGFDAVIADMRMPGMDGAQLLEEVAARHPEIPRILLTGYSDFEATVRAVNRAHIFGYLEKPWDEDRLVHMVDQSLYQLAQERERRRLVRIVRRQNAELRSLNTALQNRVSEHAEELERANEVLREGFRMTVPVFARLVETQEGRDAGHGRRVADMALQLADSLGLGGSDREQLEFAGLLHDVGKIGLDSSLTGRTIPELTRNERVALRRHAALGEAILTSVEALHLAGHWIRHHHEYYDGQGFPDHLMGNDIPLGARILTVANETDNFRTGYLLGHALDDEQVMTMLRRSRNRRYDPDVADAALELLAQGEFGTKSGGARLTAREVRPGMVLGADVLTDAGIMLLSAGTTLNERMIERLQRLEDDEQRSIPVYIDRERSEEAFES